MSKAQKQESFEGEGFLKSRDCFGGSLLKTSNAKTARPLDSKLPIHMVLRSAKGGLRLPKTFNGVNEIVDRSCRKHGVTVYKYANVGNHIHLLIKIPQRRRWNAFIRELTGKIAQFVSVNSGITIDGKFWAQRPFTRIVKGWKKAFRIAYNYVWLNELESQGHISRVQIKTLRDLRDIFESS